MPGESVIIWVIVVWCALIMVSIGVWQFCAKKPVGFWSGKTPPPAEQVRDVTAYNRLHGLMWIAYGVMMPLTLLCGELLNTPAHGILFFSAVTVGGIPLMIWGHKLIERKYLIRK